MNRENLSTVKTMKLSMEESIASEIVAILKKNQCTLTNFEEISKEVHQFFNDNATLTGSYDHE
ncbi:hypothetical protein ACPBEH_02665 [Latilactobacillus sp. 5-91]|uniref:hypothetical protein n=1 Tax=Latilactobacillus sp. 5-91 TaxID=3410924 RepID=UPI003C772FC4